MGIYKANKLTGVFCDPAVLAPGEDVAKVMARPPFTALSIAWSDGRESSFVSLFAVKPRGDGDLLWRGDRGGDGGGMRGDPVCGMGSCVETRC